MAAPKRTTRQREYDLQEISSLYLQGWIQIRIVDHLAKNRSYTVSQATISRDIKTIQARWLASSVRSFDEARANELAKIDNLENVAWQSYEASMEPIVKRKTAKKVDGQVTEATQEATRGYGDARFLDMVYKCIDRRCKLLGLDAPVKKEISGSGGGPIPFSISDMNRATSELEQWENDRQHPDDATS